jgi:hypothetical protein
MENTIIVKGTVHEPEHFVSKEGKEGTRFKLSVYAGKMDGGYAPSVWYTVKIMERLNLDHKQRDVLIDGYFGAHKGTDGKVYHTLWAKKVISTQSQAPKSFDNLPF